jgi:Ca2+-binding RTX toxin-like protein
MTRHPRIALAGALAAVVALVLPAAAPAAVGGPYQLVAAGGGTELAASPTVLGSALVVDATRVGATVEFEPAATVFPAGPCNNATPGKTICNATALAARLSFTTAAVAEVQVHSVNTTLLDFDGNVASDSLLVDGDGTIGTADVAPGAGSDSITLGPSVNTITLTGTDSGDDRYDLGNPGLVPAAPALNLDLGPGNDVVASLATGLTIRGGDGADTLSGPGPLFGDADDDLIEPTAVLQDADGGIGDDRLSFDLITPVVPLTLTKTGTDVTVGAVTRHGIERLEGGRGDDRLIGGAGSDVLAGGDGDDLIEGHGGGDTLDGGPGLNTVSYAGPSPVSVDLTAGTATLVGLDHLSSFRGVITSDSNDTVFGSPGDESYTLGAGNDVINAGPGNDAIDAGPGDDFLRGGHGTDTISGGDGHDTATYDERTASEPLSVTLATPGGDGAPGENDTLGGVEDVIGGASSDVLGGDAGPNLLVGGGGLNTIDGGAGNDTLVGGDFRDVISGGPGNDQLVGGGDDDSLDAFDGEADLVDCGPSADDDAQVDAADTVSGCEFARRGDVPILVDADGDGSIVPFDCNDNNPGIGLAATDIAGDGIDQNCDGFDEPLPLVGAALRVAFDPPKKTGTRFKRLVIAQMQRGSQVVVTCKTKVKRRCPFTRATRKPAKAGGQVSLTALLKRRLLPVGTVVELRITAPGTIGRSVRFTIRRAASAKTTDLCLLPGSSVAKKCPPDAV